MEKDKGMLPLFMCFEFLLRRQQQIFIVMDDIAVNDAEIQRMLLMKLINVLSNGREGFIEQCFWLSIMPVRGVMNS